MSRYRCIVGGHCPPLASDWLAVGKRKIRQGVKDPFYFSRHRPRWKCVVVSPATGADSARHRELLHSPSPSPPIVQTSLGPLTKILAGSLFSRHLETDKPERDWRGIDDGSLGTLLIAHPNFSSSRIHRLLTYATCPVYRVRSITVTLGDNELRILSFFVLLFFCCESLGWPESSCIATSVRRTKFRFRSRPRSPEVQQRVFCYIHCANQDHRLICLAECLVAIQSGFLALQLTPATS